MSDKILISLVSEQTIPNVIFIRELIYKNEIINKYYFITTRQMEKNNKAQSIINASLIKEKNCEVIIVENDNLENIDKKLNELKFNPNDKILVNITCGTKIMSLGIYNFFKEKGADIFYLSIGTNTYNKIYPYFGNIKTSIKVKINLKEYLNCYGINIKEVNELSTNNLSDIENFFQFYLDNKEKYYKVFEFFRHNRDISKDTIIELNKLSDEIILNDNINKKEIENFINEINIPPAFTREDCKYYSGGWFEEYIYLLIKNTKQIQDEFIGFNIEILTNNILNEIDVCFIYNNSFYLIECKTSLKNEKKSIFGETAYKLSALKKFFGLDVRAFIFVLDDSLRDKNGNFNNDKKGRAELLGLTLIDKKILVDKNLLKKDFFDKIFI